MDRRRWELFLNSEGERVPYGMHTGDPVEVMPVSEYDSLLSKIKGEVDRLDAEIQGGESGTAVLRKLGAHDLAGRNAAPGKRAAEIRDRLQAILSDVEGGGCHCSYDTLVDQASAVEQIASCPVHGGGS